MAAPSSELVAGLAPDVSSLRAARGLAKPAPWSATGHDERAAWGACKGSGREPYRVQVDLGGPAFRCSCPSRKFPCKHALALLLLWAEQPRAVPAGERPADVAEWLAARAGRGTARAAQPAAAPDPEAQARRAARREQRVAAGMAELRRWLADVARQGLAAHRDRPFSFWDGFAARMVDAQAPGVAARVRRMGGLPWRGGDTWAEELLEELALLYLLAEAHDRLDRLDATTAADVRALVGWTVAQEAVLAGSAVRDRWAVLGARIDDEDADRLRVRRTWLWGLEAGRPALLLAFAPQGAVLDPGPPVGAVLDAALAFYPGAAPLRALVAQSAAPAAQLDAPWPGFESAADALAAHAAVLARNPWADSWPVALRAAAPVPRAGGWAVAAGAGELPLDAPHGVAERLLAVSGGAPVGLFGELRRGRLRPLTAHAEGRVVAL